MHVLTYLLQFVVVSGLPLREDTVLSADGSRPFVSQQRHVTFAVTTETIRKRVNFCRSVSKRLN